MHAQLQKVSVLSEIGGRFMHAQLQKVSVLSEVERRSIHACTITKSQCTE